MRKGGVYCVLCARTILDIRCARALGRPTANLLLLGPGFNPDHLETNPDSVSRRLYNSRTWLAKYELGKYSFTSQCSGGIKLPTRKLMT